ncbi:sodium:alanine symporter [Campylobacter pinnipediorum subsp. caledonicus]|uniref:sodium-dependent transporter n=1 Tax=Campylobacter pinnipediorum TaxID=1965231 RepID=UPI00099592BE|nr:sodium-dependent transporter [Campylobacter pinnipediorum]OPA72169.1 sodium:alanine symporter [Campylobacter pinnipediorum subsp. caledonicus]
MDKFSKIGYILAVAGSAVGLGNAWKFPYMVGQNGGSAFILLYLGICFIVGVPIFLAEMSIGKLSESDAPTGFAKLAHTNKKLWSYVGMIGMLSAYLISSFYIVIIGWILYYVILSFGILPSDIEASKGLFLGFIGEKENVIAQIACFLAIFTLCMFILSRGVKSGIEKLNVWMMPSLFVLLLIMLAYSVTMNGFSDSAKFLLVPDFSKIDFKVLLDAMGLAFWTLSIGLAVIITYSASINDKTNLASSALSVLFINILLGMMIGLIIFTFIFEFGATPAQGPGLVFISLPTLFAKLGVLGNVLAVAFFIALAFAGITSAVSIIEPFTFYLVRHFNISRTKALAFLGSGILLLGVLSLLSNVGGMGLDKKIFLDKNFFDVMDFITGNIMMPLAGIGVAIFVGFVMKRKTLEELFLNYMNRPVFEVWYFLIKLITPLCVFAIMINTLFFT